MKRHLTAIATAAVLSLGFAAGAAEAAMTEMNMVRSTVESLLRELQLPTDKIDQLTMGQVQQIISIADSAEMGDGARVQVQRILGEAGN